MYRYKEPILYIIIIIIAFVYSIIRIKPEVINILNIEKDIKTKTVESNDLTRRLKVLKATDAKKMILPKQLKQIYKPVVNSVNFEDSFTVIFDDIIEMAKYNGIKIYSIKYTYNPSDDAFVTGAPEKYSVSQLNMQIIADYSGLQGFLKEIYKYQYLISIDKIELIPYKKNKKILLGNLQMKLYTSK